MANEIVRPAELPPRATPVASEVVPSDNGSVVGGVTWTDGVNAGRPLANQVEAETGVNATKAMTPLTTKQAIGAQVPSLISTAINNLNLGTASQQPTEAFATAAQGAKADTAMQPSVYDPNGKETDAFDSANQAYDNTTSGLASSTAQDAIDELAGRDVVRVEDRTALKALDGTETPAAIVYGEGGRNGVFVFVSGDQSALVTVDPSEILYVAPASDTSGASGVWSRQFDGRYVMAEWSGAPGGTSVDSAPELQALIDLCQELDLTPSLTPRRNYRLDSTLTLKHGIATLNGKRYHARLHGNYSVLFPSVTNVPAITVLPLRDSSTGVSGGGVANIELLDISFGGFLNSSARALLVGRNGYTCDNFEYSRIENLRSEGLTGTSTFHFRRCRKISVRNLVCRGGQVLVDATEAGSFTGDMVFHELEVTGSTAAKPGLRIAATAGDGVPELRGLRFNNPTLYGSGYEIAVGSNGRIGDIWFNSAQFDVGASGERAIRVHTSGTGGTKSLFGVHFVHPYITNYSSEAIWVNAAEVGDIRNIYIDGGQIGLITTDASGWNTAMMLSNVLAFSVVNTYFGSCTGAAANASYIRMAGCSGFQIVGVRATRGENMARGVQISADSTGYLVIGLNVDASVPVYDPTPDPASFVLANYGDAGPISGSFTAGGDTVTVVNGLVTDIS